MSKKSVLWGVASFAIIIALVMAMIPAGNVAAGNDHDKDLKKEWDAAVSAFHTQESIHPKAHQMVDAWFKQHKDASSSEKSHMQGHLNVCNSVMSGGYSLIYNHPGFDSSGKVIDRELAHSSVNQLRAYTSRHSGTVNAIKEHAKD